MSRAASTLSRPAALGLALLALVGCDRLGGTYKGTESKEDRLAREQGSILGDEGLSFNLGGTTRGRDAGAGVTVNSYLWRASLDTISFMPLISADPFGGVIITDWHSPEGAQNERTKVTLYILDRQLRADGVRAAVFRQVRDRNGNWADAPVAQQTLTDLENAILTRARQMRLDTAARR